MMNQVMADHEPSRIRSCDPLSIRPVARGWLARKTAECTPSTMAAVARHLSVCKAWRRCAAIEQWPA